MGKGRLLCWSGGGWGGRIGCGGGGKKLREKGRKTMGVGGVVLP